MNYTLDVTMKALRSKDYRPVTVTLWYIWIGLDQC